MGMSMSERRIRQKKYRDANSDRIKIRKRLYYESNREKVLASAAKYREANREKRLAYSVKYREANREKLKLGKVRYNFSTKYGVPFGWRLAMWEVQGGYCALPGCHRQLDLSSHKTHIDHCHTTGVARGLLCHGCNTKVGGYENAIQLGVEEYLARF